MKRLILLAFLAVLVVAPSAHASAITPGCDVTTYQGAVCAVRGYIAARPSYLWLGSPDQPVQCYYASKQIGSYRQRHGHLIPTSVRYNPRWSCHAATAGRFVVYQMDTTGRPEIWQILDVYVKHRANPRSM